jgi:hypothetical protein
MACGMGWDVSRVFCVLALYDFVVDGQGSLVTERLMGQGSSDLQEFYAY